MARRTTRNKVRWQAKGAHESLVTAQSHMLSLAVLADGQSKYVDDHLPGLVAGLEALIQTWEKFSDGL